MPSDKKRVNLTVPDAVYEQLQKYKEENGLANDATACLQLIVLQLKAQKNSKIMMKLLQENSVEQLMKMSHEGVVYAKEKIAEESTK